MPVVGEILPGMLRIPFPAATALQAFTHTEQAFIQNTLHGVTGNCGQFYISVGAFHVPVHPYVSMSSAVLE